MSAEDAINTGDCKLEVSYENIQQLIFNAIENVASAHIVTRAQSTEYLARVHNIICFEHRVGLVCTSNGFILIANVASETAEGVNRIHSNGCVNTY